jgi:ABC-type uncharacterized transport system substrate-binding protein
LDQQRPFLTLAKQVAALAARHGVPAIYGRRDYAVAGGLMSYGYDVADGRQMGNYTGRILKGENAGDLPVFRPIKFEFVINLKTAKALGVAWPSPTGTSVAGGGASPPVAGARVSSLNSMSIALGRTTIRST